MKKVYVFPREGSNHYIHNLKESLKSCYLFVNESYFESRFPQVCGLFFASFKGDVFVINWLETVAFGRLSIFQTLFALLSIIIIKVRHRKIIWIFHNIHPHNGINWKSKFISSLLFSYSNLIITHSKVALDYASKNTKQKVVYRSHPFCNIEYNQIHDIPNIDVLYWGEIYDYKGVDKMLEYLSKQNTTLRVHIIGRCKSATLRNEIISYCNSNITFDEQFASFDLIASYIAKSRFVVFPYVGNSISSSGAVIDTLALGGNIVGPNVGAFKDLKDEKLCFTYESYEELYDIICSNRKIIKSNLLVFTEENSWSKMGHFISSNI